MIVIDNLIKSFDNGHTHAVDDISLNISEGETLVLLGSSGCGKTTTLKMINKLIEPSSGSITVDGKDIATQNTVELRRSIGYVFQGIGLMPHMSVIQNIEISLRLRGVAEKKRRKRSYELLDMVDLPPVDYANQFPDQLSGGQKQRVGVARALMSDPKYLLMDEPFGALDALTRDRLQQELLQLKQQIKKTIIFVTHDIFEALTLADRIAVMHEGRIEQIGSPSEILSKPGSDFVCNLFGKPARQLKSFSEYKT